MSVVCGTSALSNATRRSKIINETTPKSLLILDELGVSSDYTRASFAHAAQ